MPWLVLASAAYHSASRAQALADKARPALADALRGLADLGLAPEDASRALRHSPRALRLPPGSLRAAGARLRGLGVPAGAVARVVRLAPGVLSAPEGRLEAVLVMLQARPCACLCGGPEGLAVHSRSPASHACCEGCQSVLPAREPLSSAPEGCLAACAGCLTGVVTSEGNEFWRCLQGVCRWMQSPADTVQCHAPRMGCSPAGRKKKFCIVMSAVAFQAQEDLAGKRSGMGWTDMFACTSLPSRLKKLECSLPVRQEACSAYPRAPWRLRWLPCRSLCAVCGTFKNKLTGLLLHCLLPGAAPRTKCRDCLSATVG